MNLEQYIGCLIMYNGRLATVTGARSNYDGDCFTLQYIDSDDTFSVNAFEDDMLNALPDPEFGLVKRRENEVVFLFDDTEYVLGSHPYEPCLYMKKDGAIYRTLHNAFNVDELPERFARGETLLGIDGKEYDREAFCNALIAAIAANRSEMDFTYAAAISRIAEERHEDYGEKPKVMNFCPSCGKKNNGGNYCTECGTKLVIRIENQRR